MIDRIHRSQCSVLRLETFFVFEPWLSLFALRSSASPRALVRKGRVAQMGHWRSRSATSMSWTTGLESCPKRFGTVDS